MRTRNSNKHIRFSYTWFAYEALKSLHEKYPLRVGFTVSEVTKEAKAMPESEHVDVASYTIGPPLSSLVCYEEASSLRLRSCRELIPPIGCYDTAHRIYALEGYGLKAGARVEDKPVVQKVVLTEPAIRDGADILVKVEEIEAAMGLLQEAMDNLCSALKGTKR